LSTEPLRPPRSNRRWKRILGWFLAVSLIVAVCVPFGVTLLLQKYSFRQRVLRAALPRVQEALGVDVHVRDFTLYLSSVAPVLEMYDVVVDGAAPYEKQTFLQAHHLSIGVRILSILQRKWYLSNVALENPIVRIFVDKNGETNIPKGRESRSIHIFDVGVRHAVLRHGEVYYNDQKSLLDADIRDLEFRSNFVKSETKYSGTVRYDNGEIHFADLNPVSHKLTAHFDATRSGINIERATVTTKASQFEFTAVIDGYVRPQIQGDYQASVDLDEARRILKDERLPAGVLKIAGSGHFQSVRGKPVLETLSMDGNIASSGLQVRNATVQTAVRDITAHYALSHGDLFLDKLHAQVFGGTLNGSYSLRGLESAQKSELHAVLQNVALDELQAVASPSSKDHLQLSGTGNATIEATWQKVFVALAARTDADVKGTISPAKTGQIVPLDGNLHAQYSATRREITLSQSYFRMPQTTLKLDGTVSERSSLQVEFQSKDLQELEGVAAAFGLTREPLGLYGEGSFTGTVSGPTDALNVAGQFSSPTLKFKGTEWRMLRATFDASPSRLVVQSGDVRTSDNVGRIIFSGNATLNNWSYEKASPFQINLNVRQLNIADLKNLAGSKAPVTGTLSANVSFHGSQLSPVGQGTIEVTKAVVAGEPIQSIHVNFQGNGDEIRGHIGVWAAAGNAQGDVRYLPKQNIYDGQISATGIRLEQIQTLQKKNIHVTGTLNATAKGSGTLDNPTLEFTARVPQFQFQNRTLSGVTLQANIANHVANFALDSQTMDTFVRGRGKMTLGGDYFTEATIDTSIISLQPILAIYLPAQATNVTGETQVHAALKGPLANPSAIDARITLPTLSLSYADKMQFAAAQPVQLDYSLGVLSLRRTTIRGTGTDIQLQGDFPITSSAPIALLAVGTLDLRLAQIFQPDLTSSGQMEFNINSYGQRPGSNLQGQIRIVNAAVAGPDLPMGLQNGNGTLKVAGDRLEIDQFQGTVSNGTLTARGAITYRPAVQFNLVIAANDIRMAFPKGLREGIDMNVTLTGSMQSPVLRGQVRLNELSFLPTFDLTEIMSEVTGARALPPQGFMRNLNIDLSVQSTNDLNAMNSKFSLQGAVNLRVRGTAAEPSVLGRINLTGGDVIFRGNRFVLQPSTIDFVNPYRIEPRVNLAIETRVQDYNVQLLARGSIDQLRTTYSSEPALPPADIINLLAFGSREAPAGSPLQGNSGAESIIASGVSSTITNRIERAAGISQLSIDPILGGNQQDPGARVTIQQRVTGNLFVTFATDATSTRRQVIQLEYQATPRVAVSGTRDQNGGFAIDIRIRKTW
jgi:translocation and assembly module TamB